MKSNILTPKVLKESMTVRVHPSIRREVEQLARASGVSLAVAVEEGMKLLVEKVKNESPKS
jgi:predicted HicB family RNase H-like nuclease